MPKITLDTDDVITVSQFAKEQGVSRQAVWNWVTRYGDFPVPLLLNKGVRLYSRRQLEAWLKEVNDA